MAHPSSDVVRSGTILRALRPPQRPWNACESALNGVPLRRRSTLGLAPPNLGHDVPTQVANSTR